MKPDGYFEEDNCDLAEFLESVNRRSEETRHADELDKEVPIYDMERLRPMLADPISRRSLMAEWAAGLRDGCGVIVLRRAFSETTAIDEATHVYQNIIAEEKESQRRWRRSFCCVRCQ